jgi:uncharacterized membrane protein
MLFVLALLIGVIAGLRAMTPPAAVSWAAALGWPKTPSRKVPVQFGARIVTGGFCGAALGAGGGSLIGGLVCGIAGAVIGTFGGAAMRSSLAKAFKKDLPAALIEDLIAIGGALFIVRAFS